MALVLRITSHGVGHVRRPRGPNPLDHLLTIRQAAALRGVRMQAVRRAIVKGILPAWTLLGSSGQGTDLYLIPRRDLDAWDPAVKPRGRKAGWHNSRERLQRLVRMAPRHLGQSAAWPGRPPKPSPELPEPPPNA